MKKKRFVKFRKISLYLMLLSVLSIYFSNKLIETNAKRKVFSEISEIPKNKVGLLLGTAKTLRNGQLNLYYKHRLEAAIKLFKNW